MNQIITRSAKTISFFLLTLPFASAAVSDRISGSLERVATYRLAGQVRKFVTPVNDRGLVPPDMQMPMMTLVIQPTAAQKSALDAFLLDIQNPASSNYHKFLTPEEYAAQFGASTNDLAKISGWLRNQGLTVDETARSMRWIRFHGNAAHVQTAFRTEIHHYLVNGAIQYANATEPAVPASLGSMVMAIRGFTSIRMRSSGTRRSPLLTQGSRHYLAPGDVATIYNSSPLLAQGIDGTGQTIAILGAAPINQEDINTFRTQFGLPAKTIQQNLIGSAVTPAQGEQIEAALDVELAGAVAPGANVVLMYGSDLEATLASTIDNNVAPVISSSFSFGYGLCDSLDYAFDAYYQQAEVQYGNALGITLVNASGDLGAAGCEASNADGSSPSTAFLGKGVGLPGAIPEVTAVGGTEFREGNTSFWNTVAGANGGTAISYIPEISWNDTAQDHSLSATGGGASVVFAKPFWQIGSGVPNDGARDVPDVSFSASPNHDPYYMCWTSDGSGAGSGNCFGVGGTSAAAPLFAGIVTLLNHYQVSKGLQPTTGQGNLNPGIYRMAQAVPAAFHDVTVGDNIVPCSAGSIDCVNGYLGFSAGIGYDLATGLGSVDAFNFVSNWNSNAGTIPTTTTLSAATGAIAQNSALLITVTVKASSGTGTPTGFVTFNAIPNAQITGGASDWQYIGKATLSGSGGTATGSFNFYPAQFGGSPPQSITAVYSGDSKYRSSGQTISVTIGSAPAKNSVVAPAINSGATNQGIIYPVDPDSDGYRYFFELDLFEVNGVGTTLTDMKIDGVSYASQLNTLFGGTQIPAYGLLAAKIRWSPPTSPYTTYVEVNGRDADGSIWTQQTPLIVVARQLFANMVLTSDPEPVQQTSNSSCPYSQQLELFETNGRSVQLSKFYENNTDLSASIQGYFGTMRLAPYGLAIAQICFSSNPGSVNWEVDGTDDLGNFIAGTFKSTYYGLPRTVPSLVVSPTSVTLNAPGASSTATSTLNLTLPSTQQWSVYTYPANKTTNWLTVYPASGYGSTAVTFQANAAGFSPGVYLAQVVVAASGGNANASPAIVNIPVVLTVGATGNVSVSGLQNAASYTQSYAPGMLMAVYGSNLAPGTQAAGSLPLPRSLQGVTATVNGRPAPLWFVSPGQVNLQVPYETGAGTAVLGINNNGSVGFSLFQVAPTAPGIFSLNGSLNPDATAKAGGQAFLYITGDGDVSSMLPTGASPAAGTPLSALPVAFASLAVTVGGLNAPVVFSAITPGSVGVTQVNFQLPQGLTGVQPVAVTVNGNTSVSVNLTITN